MGELNFIEILIYLINFAVTFVLLYILLYNPVSKFMGERRERIENSLSQAEAAAAEAEELLSQARDELAVTSEKAKLLTHEAVDNAAAEAETILDNAHEKAAEIITRGHSRMLAERHAHAERAYTELVLLAGGLASRILTREISIEDNREIADRFFEEAKQQIRDREEAGAENAAAEKEETKP